jgi:hypothetical protein
MKPPFKYLAVKNVLRPYAFKDDARTGTQFLSRVHESLPVLPVLPDPLGLINLPYEQTFDCAAARHSTAQQTCGKDARVVDDQQIAVVKGLWKVVDGAVRHAAGPAIEVKETRRATAGGRLLSD